jgi:hypothetical protein
MSMYFTFGVLCLVGGLFLGLFIDALSMKSNLVKDIYYKYSIGMDKPPLCCVGAGIGLLMGFLFPLAIILPLLYFFVLIPLAKLIDNFPYTISVRRRSDD